MSLAFKANISAAFPFHNTLVLNTTKTALFACIAISDNDVAHYDWPKEAKEAEMSKEWNYLKTIDNQDRLFALSLSHDETILVGTVQSGFKLWKLKKRDACLKLNLPTGEQEM